MKKYDVLVIGGNAGGMSAASQARRIKNDITIAVLEKGDHVSYAACGIPYYISGDVPDWKSMIAIDKDEFIKKRHIEIITNTPVKAVDFSKKTIEARPVTGPEIYAYDKLVIATGARPIIPSITGVENQNVFFLRNLAEGIAIKAYLEFFKPSSGIIIGGGYIGLEMAEALRKLSINTTILEKFESVAMSMSPQVRGLVADKLLEHEVTIRTNTGVKEISKSGQQLAVRTTTGIYTADFVLISAGIAPNTEFLRGSGLKLNEHGAVIVDEMSRTNIMDVYSAGDCATVKSLITGADVYMPLGTTANKQGRVAGLQAAGIAGEKFNGIVGSQMVKVFDLEVGKTGLNESDARSAGFEPESTSVILKSKAEYYPASQSIFVSLTIDSRTGKLIGGEVAGTDGAALRSNIIATAIASGMKIQDLAYLDLGYAPPFSPVWDAISAAAQKLLKRN